MNSENWSSMSLSAQMGNIGSEVGRALKWQAKNPQVFINTMNRAIELFDLTLMDPRWKNRLREVGRAKEVFLDMTIGDNIYGGSRGSLENYFNHFGFCARNKIGA